MTRHAQLLDELRAYEPADALEDEHHRAIVNLLTDAAHAFSRAHFTPGHITASLFIIDDGGRLLLHHHRRLGRWLQMGGHVEGEELPHEAALREGREESGLDDLVLLGGVLDVDVHAIPAGKGEPDHRHFDIRYAARTRTPERITMDGNESNDLRWVEFAAAEPLMNEAASSRVIAKLRGIVEHDVHGAKRRLT